MGPQSERFEMRLDNQEPLIYHSSFWYILLLYKMHRSEQP